MKSLNRHTIHGFRRAGLAHALRSAAVMLALTFAERVSAGSNTKFGDNAGVTISIGTDDTANGFGALQFTTTGSKNTALGSLTLTNNISGSSNTAVGYGALYFDTASDNTAVGYAALNRNTSGKLNTAVGREALLLNTTGASNVALGFQALSTNTVGSMNTAIGDGALLHFNPAAAAETHNIALGDDAGLNLTNGINNIYLGNPGGIPGGGASIESGRIRIGTAGVHTDTYLTGVIHGDGSGLTGVRVSAASLTGVVSGSQLSPTLNLAGNLTVTGSGGGGTNAVYGNNPNGTGVAGTSNSASALWGASNTGIGLEARSNTNDGVYGVSGKTGVHGISSSTTSLSGGHWGLVGGSGVFGENTAGYGVTGKSGDWRLQAVGSVLIVRFTGTSDGVFGLGKNGVHGLTYSSTDSGVWGQNESGGSGVTGTSTSGYGVSGVSTSNIGVRGDSQSSWGVHGNSQNNWGVYGHSARAHGVQGVSDAGGGDGVAGRTFATGKSGVSGFTDVPGSFGVYGANTAGGEAGHFDGNVTVNGNASVKVLTIQGADVAEPFDIAEPELPKGTVVVIDGDRRGGLKRSTIAYDHRVAGIVSGANGIRSGIVLSQPGVNEGGQNVAISGRVYVQADASNDAIQPGDMLTTANLPGHAMRASDHARAQGAVIGKAMSSLEEGTGLVLVLVTLQ